MEETYLVIAAFFSASVVVLGIYKPLYLAVVLAFLTAAFPKAGIKMGGFPFPIFLFGLVLSVVILWMINKERRRFSIASQIIFISYISWVLSRGLWLATTGSVPRETFSFLAFSIIPAMILFFSTSILKPDKAYSRSFQVGFIVAAIFGIFQWNFGLDETAIPGLTIAWGDSYEFKNNVIYDSVNGDFTKIPSTYQNGNIFGVTSGFFFLVSFYRLTLRKAIFFDYAIMAIALLMVGISGSRTALLGTLLVGGFMVLRRLSLVKGLSLITVVLALFVLLFSIQPGLAERYSLANVINSGGAGRATIWATAVNEISAFEIFVGTDKFVSAEGWAGGVQQLGLVGITLLLAFVILRTRHLAASPFIIAFLGICAILDSSYVLFPTWFIPAAMAATPVFLEESSELLTKPHVPKLSSYEP